METRVDVAVIGAGHQGLVAAASLAEAGHSVCVLEAAASIGGATRSAELTEPGSVHDVCATNLNLFAGSPFYGRHRDELERLGLRFAHSAKPFASVFPDGSALKVTCDADQVDAMFGEHSAKDLAGWQTLKRLFEDFAPLYGAASSHPLPSRHTLGLLRSLWRSRRSAPLGELARTVLSSSRALGLRHFETPEARALIAAWGMHLDYAPDISGGAVFPLLECVADSMLGMVLAEGGISHLPNALAAMVVARGGEVRTSAQVESIEVREGRARGVVLTNGDTITTKLGVVSTAALPHTASMLGAAAPDAFAGSGDDYRFGPGTFMLHLTLDQPVPWADPALGEFAYVHQGGYVDDMARTYQQACAGLLPDRPLIVVGQTSVVDPTRVSRPGRHVVWLQTRMVPADIVGDSCGTILADDWASAAQPFADRVIDLMEQNAPGFRDAIVASTYLTPLDLQNADANLVGGDTGSGSHHLDQFLGLRPNLALNRYRTPVPGLYLAGAGTWPGGGVNAISGDLAAQAVIRDHRRLWRPSRTA